MPEPMTDDEYRSWMRTLSAAKNRSETLTIFHRIRQAHGDDDPRIRDIGGVLATGGIDLSEITPLTPVE